MFDDDPTLAPEERLVLQGARMSAEIAANVSDRALAARIAQQVGAAFAEGMRQGEAARAATADEPEAEGDVFATNIRAFGPDDERARELRWID
jgi:hypothetical protein